MKKQNYTLAIRKWLDGSIYIVCKKSKPYKAYRTN